jgi:hypothetical protein
MNIAKPTFRANFEMGEGSIGNLKNFRELDPLLRADLLRDWMHDLGIEYADAVNEAFPPMEKILAKIKRMEKK